MMKKIILAVALVSVLVVSCNDTQKQENAAGTYQKNKLITADELMHSTIKDKNGIDEIDITFNNTKNTATVLYNGENIELKDQKPASGIWYKNDHYQLRGKGEEIELSKDDIVVFKSNSNQKVAKSQKKHLTN